MSVLIFAPPQPSLPNLNSELAALTRCFHRPLLAHNEIELQRAIAESGEDVDGFWFAGHAGATGIASDNGIMSPQTIAQYLSTAGVDWAFFNSCESAKFVGSLQAYYPCDVFASITEIGDIDAWRVASLVALNLSNTGDIFRAVRMAAPTGTTSLQPFPRSDHSGRGAMSQKDIEQVEELSEQLRELNRVLTGDKRYRERGLIESVQHLETQYATVLHQLEQQRMWLRLNGVGWAAVLLLELWLRFGR
jgi:hypothetical protein